VNGKVRSGRCAENWRIFIEHPELGEAVDQIFAHIIPIGGVPKQTAVDRSLEIYDQLQAAFPGKTIVVGELGWPSAGRNFSNPCRARSPRPWCYVISSRAPPRSASTTISSRRSISRRNIRGQCWPLLGILDAKLRPKFAWTGRLVDPEYWKARVRCPRWIVVVALHSAASRGDHWTGGIACRRRSCDRRLVRQRARLLARTLFLHGE